MKARVVLAVLWLLLGGLIGTSVARFAAQRHQHARAVMWLAQIHVDRMATAARAGQCTAYEEERGSLSFVQAELLKAFPLAYHQDVDFRTRADALGSAVQNARIDGTDCSVAMTRIKPIQDACEACHRLYR
jgi:cytochrome c556